MFNYRLFFKIGSWALIITGLLHSLSFINDPVATNDTEKQFFDLMKTYKFDLGNGFHRTFWELMAFFNFAPTLFSIFGGIVNLYVLKHWGETPRFKGYLYLNTACWALFAIPLMGFTFLTPMICWGVAVLMFILASLLYKN